MSDVTDGDSRLSDVADCGLNAAGVSDATLSSQHGKATVTAGTASLSKTKAELKAERRALHEAQRVATAASRQTAAIQSPSSDTKSQLCRDNTSAKRTTTHGASSSSSVDGQRTETVSAEPTSQKSKAALRAERRALQEAQRAAKAAGKQTGADKTAVSDIKKQQSEDSSVCKDSSVQQKQTKQPKKTESTTAVAAKESKMRVPDSIQVDDDRVVRRQTRKLDRQRVPSRQSYGQKKVNLFRHLVLYEKNVPLTDEIPFNSSSIHPAIIKLGVQIMENVVSGSNARCVAMLEALKKVILDYKLPDGTELSRDLEMHVRPCISFLTQCRPLSVSMGNAIKFIKHQITHVPSEMSIETAKDNLISDIDSFIYEKIQLAGKAISADCCKKICDGDIVLVHAKSSLIRQILLDAHQQGTKFRVIVTDGGPKFEGRALLNNLVASGIPCTYILISALSFAMKEVTKVFLGAHALLANGFVTSRIGSSQVALVAKAYNIPVLVCCETYKFCERVQTDSFVFNELNDPRELLTGTKVAEIELLAALNDVKTFNVLNIAYDVTPSELVSVVITELGMIPCTSVPVVLRVKCADFDSQ